MSPEPQKIIYDVELTAVTPFHIGGAQEENLERNFDYKVHNKQTWVINPDAVAAEFYHAEDPRYERLLAATPPASLLETTDFRPDSPLFRYVIAGQPIAQSQDTAIRTFVKNPFDQVYIPGSSLKGALRTLVVRHAFEQTDAHIVPYDLNRSRSWAAQNLERELLGRDPNHDLLRALHVADSQPLAPDVLQLVNARVFSPRAAGVPIALEAVRVDTAFKTTITLDNYLLTDSQAQRELRFEARKPWLTDLPRYAKEQVRELLKQEIAFYQKVYATSRTTRLYRTLLGLLNDMNDQTFLVPMGWGGGWSSKTLAYLIPPRELGEVLAKYRLGKGEYNQTRPFPQSRRAIARGRQEEAQPVAPLGWLLVQWQPCG